MLNIYSRPCRAFALLLPSLLFPLLVFGQNLQPGDLAVLGVNASNVDCSGQNTEDLISFVCFKDIGGGAVIDLTDNGWERVNPGLFGDSEGTLRMTFNTAIPKGQVITISAINTPETYTCVSHPGGITFTNVNNPPGFAMNMNSGGDQLFFMQGGTWNQGNPAANTHDASYNGGSILFGFSTSGWTVSSPPPLGSSQESNLHPEVIPCFHMAPTTGQTDFLKYTGPMGATTQLGWISRIKNPANWTAFPTCAAYNSALPNYPQPVTLQILPSGMSVECTGNCTGCAPLTSTLTFNLPTMGGPFNVVYTNGIQEFTLSNATNGSTANVTVNTTTTFSLVSVTDLQGCPVYSNFDGDATLTIASPPPITGVASNSPVCEGENLQLTAPAVPGGVYAWTGPNNFNSSLQNPVIANATPVLNGIYTLVVSVNGCSSQPATVSVTVLPGPVANSTSLTACGMNGVATFNLVNGNAAVNGNSGNPVSWYQDPLGMNPVPNPASFSSSSTTVFAQVMSGNCSSALVPVTLTVTSATTPVITGVPSIICQNASPIALPTTQGGITGQWAGNGVINNVFNPAALSGTVALTFWPPPGSCANAAPFDITVSVPLAPTITGVPASICQNANPITLPTSQGIVTGNWSGTGVTANNFNPAGLNGPYTLTFTPTAGSCASTATASITVQPPVSPTISGLPASFCENAAAFALPTTQSGVTGNWSGTGVTGNNFHPAGQSGNIQLTFTPDIGQCANPTMTIVAVNTLATPQLNTATLCQTAAPLNLNTLNDPAYPAGAWSGPGVTGNSFNPAGQSGNVTLTFTSSATCTNPATTNLTVNLPTIPQLGTASLCQNDNPLVLSSIVDPAYPAGAWSGPGVTANNFNPANQSGSVILTFTPSAACTQAGMTNLMVNAVPAFGNLAEDCNQATQTYTVSFDISNGASPYTVDGNPVGGTTFTSGTIASGTPYSFVIDDANGCGPVTVSGTANCACVTNAGTMNPAGGPYIFCYEFDSFSVPYSGGQSLDGDDVLQFVLHDNPGATLGTVIAVSNTTTFPTPPGMVLGQNYYVSAIAGTNDGTGNVDLNDPCLSVSQGLPVQFYVPTVQLTNDQTICASDCAAVGFQFTGPGPFAFDYYVTFNNLPIYSSYADNMTNDSTIAFCPADFGLTSGVVQFFIENIADFSGCLRPFNPPVTMTITIQNAITNNLSPTLCPGEPVVVNGMIYDENNPSGTETFPGGSFSGCDSIVNISLAFYPAAEFDLNETFCPGGSVTVNGTVYNQSNPAGTEILQNASANGCDSTVYINLTFNPAVTENLNSTLCPGESVVVNGMVYDENTPSGSETFPGGSYLGCDSMVNVNLMFFPPAEFNLTETLCTGGSITVNGTVYNETNPTGTEVLLNASINGCDSTVFVNLTFNSVVVNNITETLCPGESITVNGNIYNAANPSGTESFPGGSYLGCDSLVNIALSFYSPSDFDLEETLCAGESITVNGTVYNQANPNGMEILQNASVNGCDSTVFISLDFLPAATGSFIQKLCPGESVTIGGTVFNQNNPGGMVTIPNGSFAGCDSTVTVSLTFFPVSVHTIDDQFCTGSSITVNGTVYDANNPSGTEILQNASFNGCDSTVIIDLTFGNEVIVNYDPVLCAGESIFINGTLYFLGNTTGTETFPGGSYQGCDSTMIVNLSFHPEAINQLDSILPAGSGILVNGTLYNQQNPQGIEVMANGSYTGCDSTIFISLSFTGVIEAQVTINPPLCLYGTDGTIVVESITGGTPPFVLGLNGGNSAPVVNFPVVFDNLDAGFHTLTMVDALGTVIQQELFMDNPPKLEIDLGEDITVQLGSNIQLSPLTNFVPATWAWSPPDYLDCTDCPEPSVQLPTNDISYTVQVTDANGCTASGEVNIIVEKIRKVYVPNAISPNNDAINDELTVFAGPQVAKINRLMVFNRWGAVLFERKDFQPNDLQLGWDGTFKGKKVDEGVYAWFAEVAFLDGHVEVFEGGVTVVR